MWTRARAVGLERREWWLVRGRGARDGAKARVRTRAGGDRVVEFRIVREDEEARVRGGVPRGCL